MVAHKVRLTCRWERRTAVSVCRSVCVTVCLLLVFVFTCEDGFGTSGLIDSTVSIEVNVAVSSSQAERCTRKSQNTQTE